MRIFNPGIRNSDRITYDDSSSNIVDGAIASNLQNAIATLDSRLDTVESNKVKTVLSVFTSFYIDEINGIDNENGVFSSFKTLIYCLVYIRDNFIIDAPIHINLLTDIMLSGVYNLRGFELGKNSVSFTIKIQSSNPDYVNTTNNKKINVQGNLVFININSDLTIFIEAVNIESFSRSAVQIEDCTNLQFYLTNFKNIELKFVQCERVAVAGDDIYLKADNSNILFEQCNTPIISNVELIDNSYVSFTNCIGLFERPSRNLKISGSRSNSIDPYISYFKCERFKIDPSITLISSFLIVSLILLDSCQNFDLDLSLINSSGSNVSFSPNLVSNNAFYFYRIINSTQIKLKGGSDTKFINSNPNAGLFINNLSQVESPTDSTSILNNPFINVGNVIEPDAFFNGVNYRSTAGLIQTTQSTAIDALALRDFTLSSGNRIVTGSTFGFTPNRGDRWNEQTAAGVKIEDWRWNGTYWLSSDTLNTQINLVNLTAFNTFTMGGEFDSDIFIRKFTAALINPGNNDGSNYWNFQLSRVVAPNTATSITSVSTTTAAPSNVVNLQSTINLHVPSSNLNVFRISANKIGTPNAVSVHLIVTYQKARS